MICYGFNQEQTARCTIKADIISYGMYHTAFVVEETDKDNIDKVKKLYIANRSYGSIQKNIFIANHVIMVACGKNHTAFISSINSIEGDLYIINDNGDDYMVKHKASRVLAVACGRYHTAFITNKTPDFVIDNSIANKSLYVFGPNGDNQLSYYERRKIQDNVDYVCCGDYHTAFIHRIGSVSSRKILTAFGNNTFGQLGKHHSSINILSINVTAVICNGDCTAYIEDREQYVCGRNYNNWSINRYDYTPINISRNLMLATWTPSKHYLAIRKQHNIVMVILIILRQYKLYLPRPLMLIIITDIMN